jgi:hypothetical protein
MNESRFTENSIRVERMEKTAIIVAPDERGLQLIYGMPAVRRLVLLAQRLGYRSVLVVGRLKPYLPVLSDLIPADAFHEVEAQESLAQVVERLGFQDEEKVLILRANVVVDSPSLVRLLREESKNKVVFLAGNGKAGADRVFPPSWRLYGPASP